MLVRPLSYAFALALSALLLGSSSMPAHAYLDPGTGSMILQILLGGVAGVAVAGRFYWHKFLAFFGMDRDAARPDEVEDQATAQPKSQAE